MGDQEGAHIVRAQSSFCIRLFPSFFLGLFLLAGCGRNSSEAESDSPDEVVEEVVATPIDYAVAIENRVRVRSDPTLEGETLGHLYQGDLVAIFERTAEESIDDVAAPWYAIKTEAGLSGWAFGAFVERIDAEAYSTRVRRLSVSTTNVPWEPGDVSDETIRRGRWGPEDGKFGWWVDFFPTDVSVIQGRPMKIEHSGESGEPITARWRVRNGYLITEVDLADEATIDVSKVPWSGFTIWNLKSTENSFFSLRHLVPLYRDATALYDIEAVVPPGEIRKISEIEVTKLEISSIVLQNRGEVYATPSDEVERLSFTIYSNGSAETTDSLPKGHTVRILGVSSEDWVYVDTGLGWDDEGERTGWMRAKSVIR